MISLSYEQIEKVQLLDSLFNSLTIEQLKEITESDRIVAILKGRNEKSPFIQKLINEHDILAIEISSLKSEIAILRNDLHVLIKLVLKPNDYNSHSDASALKGKYNVY